MEGIKILGASGSRMDNFGTTCIQISRNTVIDAGNIIQGLGEEAKHIEHIFFTHSHLDHIVDCAFLIDNFFSTRKSSLNIYGLQETIDTLKKNIFNYDIWPDFSKIPLSGTNTPSMCYHVIELGKEYKIDKNQSLTPIKAVHTVPTCGYLIKNKKGTILFTSDTFKNPDIWELVNKNLDIKIVIIDVSFPNKLHKIAIKSKHLTPKFLFEELKNLKRDDVKIYINHIKPFDKKIVLEELQDIGIKVERILAGGETISL